MAQRQRGQLTLNFCQAAEALQPVCLPLNARNSPAAAILLLLLLPEFANGRLAREFFTTTELPNVLLSAGRAARDAARLNSSAIKQIVTGDLLLLFGLQGWRVWLFNCSY